MSKAKIEFSELKGQIEAVQLGSLRIADLKKDTSMKLVAAYKDGDDITIMLKTGKATMNVSLAGLASVRITDDVEGVKKLQWSGDTRVSEAVSTFQDAMSGENSDALLQENATFKVVHTLPVENSFKPGTSVYQNRCYKGFPDYMKKTNELRANSELTPQQLRDGYTSLRNELIQTDVHSDMAKPENQVTMPIFMFEA